MPVYDRRYQTWEGVRRGPFYRWFAIPRFAYMDFIKNRMLVAVFLIAWAPFAIRLVMIYFITNPDILGFFGFYNPTANPGGGPIFNPVTADFFKSAIDLQVGFCFVLAFLVGSGLIADDLKHNGLILLLSKPIGRWEYFLGKFTVLLPLLLVVSWLPTVILQLVNILISAEFPQKDIEFWREEARTFASITSYSLAIAPVVSLMILAASCLTKSRRYAGTIFAVVVIGGLVVASVMSEILDSANVAALSLWRALEGLGGHLFPEPEAAPAALVQLEVGEVMVQVVSSKVSTMSFAAAAQGILVIVLISASIIFWRLQRAVRLGR